jgi:hypothetical protein
MVVLQDSAIFYKKYPNSPLFNYPPFNSLVFRQFYTASVTRLAEIEAEASLGLKNPPQNLVRGFQGVLYPKSKSEDQMPAGSSDDWLPEDVTGREEIPGRQGRGANTTERMYRVCTTILAN